MNAWSWLAPVLILGTVYSTDGAIVAPQEALLQALLQVAVQGPLQQALQKKPVPRSVTGFFSSLLRLNLVATSVAAIGATIMTSVDLATFAIEPAVNPVALAIKAIRQTIFSGRIGAVRLAIQATIDAIAFLVEAMLDAITTIDYAISRTIGCTIFRAVSLIGIYGSADDQQNA